MSFSPCPIFPLIFWEEEIQTTEQLTVRTIYNNKKEMGWRDCTAARMFAWHVADPGSIPLGGTKSNQKNNPKREGGSLNTRPKSLAF